MATPHAHFAFSRAQKQWDVFTSHAMHHAACQLQPREEAQPTTRPSSWLLVPTLAPSRMPRTLLEAKGPFVELEVNFLVLRLRSRSIRS